MGFSRVYCVICGTQVPYRYRVNSCQRDFRAIRCDKDSKIDGEPFLTGIGGYVPRHLLNCAAPSDPELRWDDADVVLSEDDSFPALIGRKAPPQPGFVFHEVCWNLLQELLYPHSVPIKRFYDICLSCPASKNGWLDWGHSYGGLMDRLPSAGYPWEDVYVAASVKKYLGLGEENSPLIFSKADPSDVPEIRQALRDSRECRQESDVTNSNNNNNKSEKDFCVLFLDFQEETARDCFRALPLEILDYIQTLLPSRSVANVRLASRSFASLELSQSFWASRFDRHQERGYCVEATHPLFSTLSEQRTRDWKLLYEKTGLKRTSSSSSLSDELRNRKRVWDCSRGLVDLLLEEPLTDPALTRNLQTSASQEEEESSVPSSRDETWRPVGGDSSSRTPSQPPSGMPCRVIYEQVVPITSRIKSLGLSFREFNDEQYISGVRVVFDQDHEAVAGYVLPCKETYLDLHGGGGNYCGGELTGIIIAVSPKGIKALRAVTGTGHITDWAGCPNDLPQTVRLCMREPIPALKISVDGFKLVSISTPTSTPPLFPPTDQDPSSSTRSCNKDSPPPPLALPPQFPIRTTGLWYPSIPPPTQNLHSQTFPGRDVSLNEYRPLVHLIFAGPNATYLKHLTRISVTVSMAAIVGVDFYYDETAPVRFLQTCKSTASGEDSVTIPFSVDGPGGEVLTGLQGGGDFFLSAAGRRGEYKYGAITSLKVTTNHNRSFIFQPSAIPILKLPAGPYIRQRSQETVIPSGSTLTGMYFMHDPKFGMVDIGPISEDLEDRAATAVSRCESIEDEIRTRMRARSSVN